MTDQDPWRQQVERQLADLLDRMDQLESSIDEMAGARIGSRLISRRSTNA